MFKRVLMISGLLLLTNQLMISAVPTPEAARQFIDYYLNGQNESILLADMKICRDVAENECVDNVEPDMLEQGTSYMIWCLFVVPGTDREENLIIQFNHNGITRMTRELTVSSSIRWRTWRSLTTNRQ